MYAASPAKSIEGVGRSGRAMGAARVARDALWLCMNSAWPWTPPKGLRGAILNPSA